MNKKEKKRLKVIVFSALLIVCFLVVKVSIQNKHLPGTTVSSIDISYKTTEEAEKIIKEKITTHLNNEIVLNIDKEQLITTPAKLGINIDLENNLQKLKKANSEKGSLLKWLLRSPKNSEKIELTLNLDQETFYKTLDEKFKIEERNTKDAKFYLDGKKLLIQEEKHGYTLDTDSLQNQLLDSAKKLNPQKLTSSFTKKDPKFTKELLEAQQEAIKQQLLHKFTLIDPIYSDDWHIQLINFPEWVEFKESGKHIIIEINETALNAYTDEELSQWLDKKAEEVKIYKDEEGKVQIEGQGHNGTKVQRKELKAAIEKAVAEGTEKIEIPIVEVEPKLNISEELQELGIKERLSVGHTSYYGSPANRVHNIKTGAKRFNGVLIPPGETFSFNTRLGRVDASTGYRKELVIKPEGTIPEYGGGICQVSTTLYRAALTGGIPIPERNQHSYAVGYYAQVLGHGLDATIYLGGPDLNILNDSANHMLLQSYVVNDYEIYFIIYGHQDQRTVELEGPYLSGYHNPGPTVYEETTEIPAGTTKQVEKPHTGFTVLWYRHITDKDGKVETEEILTRYKAIPRKILVGVPATP